MPCCKAIFCSRTGCFGGSVVMKAASAVLLLKKKGLFGGTGPENDQFKAVCSAG